MLCYKCKFIIKSIESFGKWIFIFQTSDTLFFLKMTKMDAIRVTKNGKWYCAQIGKNYLDIIRYVIGYGISFYKKHEISQDNYFVLLYIVVIKV